MRLLALGPQNVVPPTDGGKEGIHGALQALAQRMVVTYVFPTGSPDRAFNGVDATAYSDIGVNPVPVNFHPSESFVAIATATALLQPFKFRKYGTPRATALVDAALGMASFDAILCFHAHTEGLGRRLKRRRGWKVPILVREHNIEYELVAHYRNQLDPLRRLLALPFEALTRREEKRIWTRADSVAFLTDRDLAKARSDGTRGRMILAPEGVPIPLRRVISHPAQAPRLLLLLNPKATQSVANLQQFLNGHWRKVYGMTSLQRVDLDVTGVSTAQLSRIVNISVDELRAIRVSGIGFVPDLTPVFASSLALISPTFVGGGIRKKILEAMANQVPVLASDLDLSSSGYFDPPNNVLRIGNAAEFAASVDLLLGDSAVWHEVAENGRRTVEQHASWNGFAEVLAAEVAQLVEATAGHRDAT